MAERFDPHHLLANAQRALRSTGKVLVTLALGGADSGRVVRHPLRRRRAAASAEPAPPTRWAHATVYAIRTVQDESRGDASGTVPVDASVAASVDATWTVREVDTRATPGACAPRCLIFENHVIVRRVWDFPRSWPTLPAAALLRLAGVLR